MEKLLESEERFRAIYEHAPVLIYAFDENGRCLVWNNECEKTFGWTVDEIIVHGDALSLFYPGLEVRNEVIQTVTTDPDAKEKASTLSALGKSCISCGWTVRAV